MIANLLFALIWQSNHCHIVCKKSYYLFIQIEAYLLRKLIKLNVLANNLLILEMNNYVGYRPSQNQVCHCFHENKIYPIHFSLYKVGKY